MTHTMKQTSTCAMKELDSMRNIREFQGRSKQVIGHARRLSTNALNHPRTIHFEADLIEMLMSNVSNWLLYEEDLAREAVE